MESTVNFSKNGPFGGPVKPNYPRNCWWLAALSEEITDKPYGCWILSNDARGSDYPEVLAMADHAAVRARRVLQGWLERD